MIEINGKQYEQINHKPTGKGLTKILLAATMLGGSAFGGSKRDNLPDCDIVKEFGLIQQKKSKYSKSVRDRIVGEFNYYFKEIKP